MLVVKEGRSDETVCADGHDSDTHSLACARLTAGSSAVTLELLLDLRPRPRR